MNKKFGRLGRETLEIVETLPLNLVEQVLFFREADDTDKLDLEWPTLPDEDDTRIRVLELLDNREAEDLKPIEERCRRIRLLAADKGPSSLSHVTQQRLSNEELLELDDQPDAACRSAWVFLNHQIAFADAEAFHGARQYRDFGKMYDAFEVEPAESDSSTVSTIDAENLASLLTAKLELPSKVIIRTIDLSATSTHPASLLVIVRHAGPLSSVFHHKENGLRAPIYYRPPNEATLIWTPSEQTLEVCGPSPQVRRVVAEGFAQTVCGTDLSTKPLTWRYYDLSRFHASLDLPPPDWEDVDVRSTKIIAVEMRLGNWSRRLSLKVTIDDDIAQIAKRYLGGNQFLGNAEGFSSLIVAVSYQGRTDKRERTMEISFGDRRSNLQGKTDSSQRELGQRLLKHWGILNRLKPLEFDEVIQTLPQLLGLHDLPDNCVTGARLRNLGLDPKRLADGGVIAFRKRSRAVLLEDDDEVLIDLGPRDGEVTAQTVFEEKAGSLDPSDVTEYEIKREWLEEIVAGALRPFVGRGPIQRLNEHLSYFGKVPADGSKVPIYLARCVNQIDALTSADVTLRSRQEGGVGIVLTATDTPINHLGPNVVVSLPSVLGGHGLDADAIARILDKHKVGRWLALGGADVALMKFGPHMAMLYIPNKIPLAVSGAKQITILERLVAAHKAGSPGVNTGNLIADTGARTPADAWRSDARKTVVGVYFEHAGRNLWRLKVD
ncbi:hypothetical protein [Neogemmobacter tilapiae]|uniref:Uncharacterized protein n=1 Tax=Neogemmobacter tilapiae TaxID=875041 RepID=A0A918TWS8_9RHOB|nr:hypothetical protein [Gemmobacter tilapiae]GHC66404.1 hypothetical protein GCM10007315_33910 [Gemmobacter tilapiae]